VARNCIRKHIALEDKKQEETFEKFSKDAGFGSFSQMARYVIIEASMKFYKKDRALAETEQLQNSVDNAHHVLHSDHDWIKEKMESIEIRIKKAGLTSKVPDAIKGGLELLAKRDMDHTNILCELRKIDEKTLDTTICLLEDSDLIGHRSKTPHDKIKKEGEK